MQAALYIREKQKQRQKKYRRGRFELPSHVATKEIAPFPVYPPTQWGKAAAAWAERDRRASEAAVSHRARHHDPHRRWISRNRIHDSSYGGSSSEEEEGPGLYGHQSAAANALLYVGLGTVAIGLVIAFVGTGEKGFKTLELRLIGPTLIAGGLLCCLLRILLCVCPTRCLKRKFRQRRKKRHISAELNRHFDKNDYYRHLPFNARTAEDFMLMEQTNKKTKKRVSILPAVASTSERREIPKIMLPNIEQSPAKEGNLIELKPIQGGSFEDLPSISSDDSFNLDQSLALFDSKGGANSTERLARLKSTLTFGDSLDAGDFNTRDHVVSRIDEEDSEHMDFYSNQGNLNSPLLFQHQNDSEQEAKELVLSPSNLQND
ncbi:uncharacterized protein LOC106673143 isoform X2 [Cimex lectularius]|uniref:Uncharacterized protein n=1 Tax=Cimex lectularius TaxID=79782 RepID=A0A8I6SA05_CIMLE|nr:uncharacterized protein LOC106673143 isoform X2 [Cimex lectularius]